MARQDIYADAAIGDVSTTDNLTNKLIYDFLLLDERQEEDSERFCYGEITVAAGIERKLPKGIHVKIPYYPVYRELKIRFGTDTGNGNREYLLNRTDNTVWFPVFLPGEADEKLSVSLSAFQELDDNGVFCLVLKEGCLMLYSGNETDLEIKPALPQNEVFLLKAMAGNLYQHPTTGVGLIEFLHGNFENNGLAAKLQQEFENDNMVIVNAYMDSASGELLLDVKEKNG
jgi:hypothetical protein